LTEEEKSDIVKKDGFLFYVEIHPKKIGYWRPKVSIDIRVDPKKFFWRPNICLSPMYICKRISPSSPLVRVESRESNYRGYNIHYDDRIYYAYPSESEEMEGYKFFYNRYKRNIESGDELFPFFTAEEAFSCLVFDIHTSMFLVYDGEFQSHSKIYGCISLVSEDYEQYKEYIDGKDIIVLKHNIFLPWRKNPVYDDYRDLFVKMGKDIARRLSIVSSGQSASFIIKSERKEVIESGQNSTV